MHCKSQVVHVLTMALSDPEHAALRKKGLLAVGMGQFPDHGWVGSSSVVVVKP